MLKSVETIKVSDLPAKAMHNVYGKWKQKVRIFSTCQLTNCTIALQMWTPAIMLEFLFSVIEWMQSVVQGDRDRIYRFVYEPDRKVITARALEGDVSNLLDDIV